MGMLEPEVKAQFSQPFRQIMLMLIVLGLTGALVFLAYPRVSSVFLANPWLNGVIAGVFVIGVLACFFQVAQMSSSVRWIEGFAAQTPGHEHTKAPRLLAPLAALLRTRGKQMQISASSSRSILDSVASRIEEVRDITLSTEIERLDALRHDARRQSAGFLEGSYLSIAFDHAQRIDQF